MHIPDFVLSDIIWAKVSSKLNTFQCQLKMGSVQVHAMIALKFKKMHHNKILLHVILNHTKFGFFSKKEIS